MNCCAFVLFCIYPLRLRTSALHDFCTCILKRCRAKEGTSVICLFPRVRLPPPLRKLRLPHAVSVCRFLLLPVAMPTSCSLFKVVGALLQRNFYCPLPMLLALSIMAHSAQLGTVRTSASVVDVRDVSKYLYSATLPLCRALAVFPDTQIRQMTVSFSLWSSICRFAILPFL